MELLEAPRGSPVSEDWWGEQETCFGFHYTLVNWDDSKEGKSVQGYTIRYFQVMFWGSDGDRMQPWLIVNLESLLIPGQGSKSDSRFTMLLKATYLCYRTQRSKQQPLSQQLSVSSEAQLPSVHNRFFFFFCIKKVGHFLLFTFSFLADGDYVMEKLALFSVRAHFLHKFHFI